MDRKKTEIITIANIKGGVGKSILTIIFSYILKGISKRVLVIDLDPQNSLTSYFMRYIKNLEINNVYEFLKENINLDLNKYLSKINASMYLMPSHPNLHLFNQQVDSYKVLSLKHRLKKSLISDNFDYILIDTPPNLDSLLDNALHITDKLIVPIQVERFSVESLSILMKHISKNFYVYR
ncbi:ATPase, para family protein (plasmid) [Borrelia coriaceae ATCC 43381]|uniref:ATPase, para family protein n=1 Tax=Borrelia coriaceae ATCC 43381 TaxID=1408429 RepID=W5T401_9SPIR|nr:ATPase, para family protein [Borrelia coriaceae ATCC 43381]